MGLLFRHRNRPRASLDFKVGTSHVVEVLLHLRRADWIWYESNHQAIHEDFFRLMEESVMPRMFGDEIESFHKKSNPQIFPPDKKIGSRNVSRGESTTSARAGKRKSKRDKSTNGQKKQMDALESRKRVKDVYYAFGDILQLAFRKQALPEWHQGGRTILMEYEGNDEYKDRPKLPHRILVWWSKLDVNDKTSPDPENVGFFRPEMIPITSLFREPKEVEES